MIQDVRFNFPAPESSQGFLLWKTTHVWQSGIKKLLEGYNLTHPQFVVLAVAMWYIQVAEIAPTQKNISQRAEIDTMTVSVIIRGLIKKGFIVRVQHPTDTRAYSITLTEEGKDVLQKAMNAVDAYDIEFF